MRLGKRHYFCDHAFNETNKDHWLPLGDISSGDEVVLGITAVHGDDSRGFWAGDNGR